MWKCCALLLLVFSLLSYSTTTPPKTVVELGERLFFDPVLSLDSTVSCASCHIPAYGFADTLPLSRGVGNQLGERNSPSAINMAGRPYFFYDGRAATLEEQVLMPIHNPVEMALPVDQLLARLQQSAYRTWFEELYGQGPDSANLSNALATYLIAMESPGDAAFDYWMAGDTTAMTASQVRGRLVFNEKGKCFDCHFGPDFTGDEFRNIGLYNGSDTLGDVGRFLISQDSLDLGRFKVPGLRNIALTAPYMHNGAFETLEEVVAYYDSPDNFVSNSINRDTLLAAPLGLSPQEKADLVAFLEALTDARYQD